MNFRKTVTTAMLATAVVVGTAGVANASPTIVYTIPDNAGGGLLIRAAVLVTDSNAQLKIDYTNTLDEPTSMSVLHWDITSEDIYEQYGMPMLYFKGASPLNAAEYAQSDMTQGWNLELYEDAGIITCTDSAAVTEGSGGAMIQPGDSLTCTSTVFTWSGPVPGQDTISDYYHYVDDEWGGVVDNRIELSSVNEIVASDAVVTGLDGVAVTEVSAGDQVQYSFTVTNIGEDSTTTALSGTDGLGLSYTCDQPVLESGESTVCTSEPYTVTDADAVNGSISTVARATATTAEGVELTASVDLPTLTVLGGPTPDLPEDPTEDPSEDPSEDPTEEPTTEPTPTDDPTSDVSAADGSAQSDSLATTGSAALPLMIVGLLATVGGAVLTVVSRRRRMAVTARH